METIELSEAPDIWMVRAGSGGYLSDEFLNRGLVAIGWKEFGDLTKVANEEELRGIVEREYEEEKQGKVTTTLSQVRRFRFEFSEEDWVITYDPDTRLYHLGRVAGSYEFVDEDDDLGFPHRRDVEWEGSVDRDELRPGTRNTLGSTLTIFRISGDEARDIWATYQGLEEVPEDDEGSDFELVRENVKASSHEFIKDLISGLTWDETEELVAGLLRGMGYKTVRTPHGPDRGRDITASPDPLGLESPRIIVEVKNRSKKANAKEIRNLMGALRGGARGLFVSLNGFTTDAKYEAERADQPVTLVDLDHLVDLLTEYYDELDQDTVKLVPLEKIYWPK